MTITCCVNVFANEKKKQKNKNPHLLFQFIEHYLFINLLIKFDFILKIKYLNMHRK
jgi:hypothetical protein